MFFPSNFNILFSFTNNSLLHVLIPSYITQAGCGFLFFKRNKLFISLVIHFILILYKSSLSLWNFLRKLLEDYLFFSQYGKAEILSQFKMEFVIFNLLIILTWWTYQHNRMLNLLLIKVNWESMFRLPLEKDYHISSKAALI